MITLLRWIAVLPGSVIAAWLGWLVSNIASRISLLTVGVSPDSFVGRLSIEMTSSAVLGAAFIYAGCYIAPAHQQRIALSLAALAIIAAVVFAAFAVRVWDYWALWSDLWMVIAAVALGLEEAARQGVPKAAT
jgi:hypothetical protein